MSKEVYLVIVQLVCILIGFQISDVRGGRYEITLDNEIFDDYEDPVETLSFHLQQQFELDFESWKQNKSFEDENSMPTPEMIKSYGFEVEIHHVVTEDGYINTLHRIPSSKSPSKVVFLQHGLLGTSADFVMGCPEKSLGYILANQGFDVWLGNARGNAYSRAHEFLSIYDPEYWSFSFDEMGKYDIPAAVDYILNNTQANDLYYIGHSMGTSMFWVAMNQPETRLNSQIRMMIALAPVAKVANIKSPIKFLAPYVKEIEYLFSLLGIYEFVPSNRLIEMFDSYACDKTMRQLKLCQNVLFLLSGFDGPQANLTLLPIILGHEPGGGSTRTVIHFAQEISSGRFCAFDFGDENVNMEKYNSSSPPDYQLSEVKVPVALFWSENDWLADPKDVEYILNNLPNVVVNYKVPLPEFNHVDFIWAIDAKTLVFDKILSLLSDN